MSAKINSSRNVHSGRVFKLNVDNITLSNGVTFDIDIIRHPGASAMVPMLDKDTVLLIKQYRYAAGDFIWEIPAGTLNSGESPLECAKRELIEETGFSADKMEKLTEIVPFPDIQTSVFIFFLQQSLKRLSRILTGMRC
jgi:8-oxo-dGTP pyrophosphatase MutT (NUDIX family)